MKSKGTVKKPLQMLSLRFDSKRQVLMSDSLHRGCLLRMQCRLLDLEQVLVFLVKKRLLSKDYVNPR